MSVINISKKNLNKLGYKDLEDWLQNSNHVYIGRNMTCYVKGAKQSKWCNKFSVKTYGRDKCLELYHDYIIKNNNLMKDIMELDGKILGCWCKPESCHGDILLKIINNIKNEK